MRRIYLDNAATSWPKPEAVYAAVDRYQREIGAAAGRSAYRRGGRGEPHRRPRAPRASPAHGRARPDADRLRLQRHRRAEPGDPRLLRPGDHVVTTVCEHNSVLRPLADAGAMRGVEVTYVGCDAPGTSIPTTCSERCDRARGWSVVTHASNVTGAVQPVAEIATSCTRARRVAARRCGADRPGMCRSTSTRWDVDLVAASGHKGLLGPLGTGVLYIRPGIENELSADPPRRHRHAERRRSRSPTSCPTRTKPEISTCRRSPGLAAATRFLREQDDRGRSRASRGDARSTRLLRRLARCRRSTSYGPRRRHARAAVVSFSVEGYDPQEFAAVLDSSFGVQCRAGLHCAPRMHAALGTLPRGGTVRFSCGWSTTVDEVDRDARRRRRHCRCVTELRITHENSARTRRRRRRSPGTPTACGSNAPAAATAAPAARVRVGQPGRDRRAGQAAWACRSTEFERQVRPRGRRPRERSRSATNYDCVFLDAETRRCTVYEDRPRQCRTWPFWDSKSEVARGLAADLRSCPGSGTGSSTRSSRSRSKRRSINI